MYTFVIDVLGDVDLLMSSNCYIDNMNINTCRKHTNTPGLLYNRVKNTYISICYCMYSLKNSITVLATLT